MAIEDLIRRVTSTNRTFWMLLKVIRESIKADASKPNDHAGQIWKLLSNKLREMSQEKAVKEISERAIARVSRRYFRICLFPMTPWCLNTFIEKALSCLEEIHYASSNGDVKEFKNELTNNTKISGIIIEIIREKRNTGNVDPDRSHRRSLLLRCAPKDFLITPAIRTGG